MTPHTSTFEQLPALNNAQAVALSYAEQMDGLRSLIPEGQEPVFDLHYPAKDGVHPGIQYKGYDDYPDADGKLEIGIDGNGRYIALYPAEGSKIGRPHFHSSVDVATQAEEAERFDELRMLIDYTAERPLVLMGITRDSEPKVLEGFFPRDLRWFAEVCLKAAERKVEKRLAAANTAGQIAVSATP